MRLSTALRAGAWGLVAAGVAAPLVRRRVALPGPVVLASGALSLPALAVAVPRTRARDLALCALNMWTYLAAYKMPNDNPEALRRRVRIDYPIEVDRIIGLGVPPTVRLQARADPAHLSGVERALVWCHWVWFAVPHGALAYVLWRAPRRFDAAAARMYAVFDLGAVIYWALPTAPPWWASEHGRLHHGSLPRVRRKMIDYGQEFWGERWPDLYDVLGGNPLAAMPSLHFATTVMAARLLGEVGPVAGAVGWAYAIALGVALVYLGEHYVVDLLAGGALAETVRTQSPRVKPALRLITGALQALERRAAAG
ncbi:MAG TPA: phosphatase PAP2 family protein [Solirubrobacteraceae bacterium]|nr:phosphatase PAP2 family protein [Solirubrobacteraceae bacterium]